VISETFKELFVHPKDAIERSDWGKEQMGYSNKISSHEFRTLLGWNIMVLLQEITERLLNRIYLRAKRELSWFRRKLYKL
jgi:hypothetical protein